MSNITSSDSDATISYGSESRFDEFTIEEIGRTSVAAHRGCRQGPSQGNGFDKRHSTCSFSGEDSDSDTDDYYTELSSSTSDEVWL